MAIANDVSKLHDYFEDKYKNEEELKNYIESKLDQLKTFSKNSEYVCKLIKNLEDCVTLLHNPRSNWTKNDIDIIIENYNKNMEQLNNFVAILRD